MSTPTGKDPNELSEAKSARSAELTIDLSRLEAVLAGLERELWAPRLPPVSQLPPVPGLARPGRRAVEDVQPLPVWLKPERVAVAPEMMQDRGRVSWPLVILIGAACALPVIYFAAGRSSPLLATSPQLASPSTTPVGPPAPAPMSLPVLARDDSSELDAGDTPSSAGVPRAAKSPERENLAMLKSDARVIAAPAPKPAARSVDPETVALLIQQGEQLAEAGDFAAARTLFQRAAEAGSATAATALAATYDPAVLARMGVVGITPDMVKARFWYEKAASLGSSDAKRRLELLANP
jgi:hypothetical protein